MARDQCSWIVRILLVCVDVILWVTGLLHNYNTGQFITSYVKRSYFLGGGLEFMYKF